MFLKTASVSLTILFATGILLSQDPPEKSGPQPAMSVKGSGPNQISGGVLNGKAISLPKPPYPAAARAVGASGSVSVQVLIDVNGDVISASAVSGHPLLRPAATEAARGAKFSPTKLMGEPVKVSGVITYNFVGPLMPANIAYTIAYAERKGYFGGSTNVDRLLTQLPGDWMKEKEILTSLTYEDPVKESSESVKPSAPARSDPKPPQSPDRFTVKGDIHYSAAVRSSEKLDQRSIDSLRSLKELIGARWSQDPSLSWSVEFGATLGFLSAEIDDDAKLISNLSRIESLLDKAPSTASEGLINRIRNFVEAGRGAVGDPERKREVTGTAELLSNLRY